MTTSVKNPPPGYPTVAPYLSVVGADRLIDFMKQVLGAEEQERILRPNGAINHAEVRIDDSVVMLGEVGEGMPATPAMLYVPDADAAYQRAGRRSHLGAGARRSTARRPPGRGQGRLRQFLVVRHPRGGRAA